MVNVIVVGAGIVGTTCAYQIKNSFPDFDVTILAETFTPNNTSDGAAGLFAPPHVYNTQSGVIYRWSKASHNHALSLLKSPDAVKMGVSIVHGSSVLTSKDISIPHWKDIVLNFHILTEEDLKQYPPNVKSGYSYSSIFIESTKYIPSLSSKFIERGGKIIIQKVTDICSLFESYDIVVNCSGLGSRNLVNDVEVFPVRGQTARVKAPWIKEYIRFIDNDEEGRTIYIFPLQDDVVLGGTKQENNDSLEVSKEDHDWIMKSTEEFLPSLKDAEFICDWVGLRPGRATVRLEKEVITFSINGVVKHGIIIHNYGHGANGITLAWGCGENVVSLIKETINDCKLCHAKL